MPRISHILGWATSVLFAGLILVLLPYDERSVIALRLGQRLESSKELQGVISSQCRQLIPQSDRMLERKFVAKLAPRLSETPIDPFAGICTLRINESHYSRFWLYQHWRVQLSLTRNEGQKPVPLYTIAHSISVPLPLCLLPLLAYLLAIFFDYPSWKLSYSAGLYLLFISGFNLIELFRLIGRSAQLTLLSDRVFTGFFLVSLWLALYRNNESMHKLARSSSTSLEYGFNRLVSGFIGMWNPAFYTLIAPLIYPVGKHLKRLAPFFNGQLLLITLSLSLLGLDFHSLRAAFYGLLLPRYLSFAVIFFLALSWFPKTVRPQILLWQLPSFWKHAFAVCFGELLALFIPWVGALPGLMRVGASLILCEFSRFKPVQWKPFWEEWRHPLSAIVVSALISIASTQSGVFDLVISICDPRKHPTALIPFTLLSGVLLGFLSGGLIPPFFVFVSELVRDYPTPLMHACLLDGVLVGLILSPFSLYNLFPSFEFNLSIKDLILVRWKQLGIPIVVGFLIYLLGAASSVGILQPVTFLFFCMAAVVYKLRTVDWNLERFGFGKETEE